jgi:hypothetical protein
MARPYSTNGREDGCIEAVSEKARKKEEQDVGGWITLGWIL